MSSTSTFAPLTNSTPAPAKRRFYRPELDVLRFLAFLAVFGHHAQIDTGARVIHAFSRLGIFGVQIFFILSAYLITELMLTERNRTSTVDLQKFYVRRILRVWPVYFLALAVAVLLGLLIPGYYVTVPTILCYTFLLGNVFQATHALPALLYPLWTLSIEEQFYAVIPSCGKWLGSRGLWAFSALALFAAYAAITILTLGHGPQYVEHIHYNSFVQFQFFAAGTVLALLLHGRDWTPSGGIRVAMGVVGLAAMAGAIGVFHMDDLDGTSLVKLLTGYGATLGGALCLFLSFMNTSEFWGRSVFGVLRYLGKISYGLYMYHVFALATVFRYVNNARTGFFSRHLIVGDLLAFAATVGLATLSYRYMELPIMRFKERFAIVKSGS